MIKFFSLLFLQVSCDEMKFIDYSSSSQFDWSVLQGEKAYSVESEYDIVKFNVGKDIEETCGGHYASAIRFSKAGDSCEILGHHESVYYSIFASTQLPTIAVYYGSGEICRDHIWGDVKRRIEFKLICSSQESEFFKYSCALFEVIK